MVGLEVDHYFSPRTNAGERFWIPVQTYAADGDARPNQEALRFVSLALHILPTRVEGAAGTFQRGTLPDSLLRKRIKALA